MTMTATKAKAEAEFLITAGSKRIMGVARSKGIASVEVFELVVRWGQYIDQAIHPDSWCGTCKFHVHWNSFENHYIHTESGHQHCSTHAGRTANV